MTSWKDNLKEAVSDVKDERIKISSENAKEIEAITQRHPMLIPEYYLNLIDQTDENDPIKKLSVPNVFENDLTGDYDTSGESTNTKLPGLQHKYMKTALVLTTSACFMYCRHCFRKRMVGFSNKEVNSRLKETVDYLTANTGINNVLLSGGDSFCLQNSQIEAYLEALTKIDHLDFIRFGTRSLVVFPERISSDPELIELLKRYNKIKRIIIVTQFNHPRELTDEAQEAIDLLRNAGISIVNQAVILKGVNDKPEVLAELLNKLTRVGIDPYYVFQCRPVKAVKSGFQMTLKSTYELLAETRPMLNGLSKRFRFIMSHTRGKIEIMGVQGDQMIFKFHQAKDEADRDVVFIRTLKDDVTWMDSDLNLIH